MKRLVLAIAIYLALAAVFTGGVWWFAYSSALDQLEERAQSDLSLAADRLTSRLEKYRALGVFMANHPMVQAALAGTVPIDEVADLLLWASDRSGARDYYLLSADGDILASSDRRGAGLAAARAGKPSFQRAMQGALGAHHEVLPSGERAYVFAVPVFGENRVPLGAVSVEVDIPALEAESTADPEAVFFTDDAGVIFIANRTELLLADRGPGAREVRAAFGYTRVALPPFPGFQARTVSGHELWVLDGGRYLPTRALHQTVDLPVIGLRGEILLDAGPAARLAGLQALVAAAVALVFGAVLLLLQQRRQALSARLTLEEQAKALLESRVAARTRELSEANLALRHEVIERKEAEDALKRAQQELVQAGKLSALGKMSAGLSHELNQPLMAIQSFAENGALFLERGAPDKAGQNLGKISELARRMGRIIKNLRAFARQESEPIATVDLVAVVEAVLDLSETRMNAAGVDLIWDRPDNPMLVRGGEVRLQQVLLNLVSNALDAMTGQDRPRLEITLSHQGDLVHLSVHDSGPGITEPEKIFDPFYSTKEVGQSEGMGLGLSISYGLVQSFGGAIRGRNHPEGGAVFTVELAAVRQEEHA
ncbi:ATP-binding protein [Actibacterium sp.]|uniref:sensor histidine kinase n=1 Tax=Actibacterium sp. TaxID=1872125 RepID=UPI003567E38A